MIEAKFFFNKEVHEELADEANRLAARKGVQVSRWVTNRGSSRNRRQEITYIVHTGERNQFASRQADVMFRTSEEQRGSVRDEQDMLNAVIAYLNSIPDPETFVNVSERYGNAEIVVVQDYLDLNPGGDFRIVGDEIHEYDANGNFVEIVAATESD